MSKSKPNAIVLQGFPCMCRLYKGENGSLKVSSDHPFQSPGKVRQQRGVLVTGVGGDHQHAAGVGEAVQGLVHAGGAGQLALGQGGAASRMRQAAGF